MGVRGAMIGLPAAAIASASAAVHALTRHPEFLDVTPHLVLYVRKYELYKWLALPALLCISNVPTISQDDSSCT